MHLHLELRLAAGAARRLARQEFAQAALDALKAGQVRGADGRRAEGSTGRRAGGI